APKAGPAGQLTPEVLGQALGRYQFEHTHVIDACLFQARLFSGERKSSPQVLSFKRRPGSANGVAEFAVTDVTSVSAPEERSPQPPEPPTGRPPTSVRDCVQRLVNTTMKIPA